MPGEGLEGSSLYPADQGPINSTNKIAVAAKATSVQEQFLAWHPRGSHPREQEGGGGEHEGEVVPSVALCSSEQPSEGPNLFASSLYLWS